MKTKFTRRLFIYLSLAGLALVSFPLTIKKFGPFIGRIIGSFHKKKRINEPQKYSHIYLSRNGIPQQNVKKVMELMGGIEKFIGIRDIVILKPNCQWWNQGRTNLAAMKGFIDLVLGIPNFQGEIIVAENQHFMDESLPESEKDNIRGWTRLSEINGDIDGVNHSMNSLIDLFNQQGHPNVTKVSWRDGGPKHDDWGNGQNGGIVKSPNEGDGYIWSDIDYTFSVLGLKKWKVKMTYPVFTSPHSGITIDFKKGAFLRDKDGAGRYLKDRPVKFINFATLNDHWIDTGITSSIKNYMGITDMSCGDWGVKPEGYYNVHACGGRYFSYAKSGPLGYFMKTIRKSDLNIVTAEWVGWGCRINISKATQTKTILASTDPIALDYYGAKYLVYPLSQNKMHHDPDNRWSSFRNFLELALSALGEGTLDESFMKIHQYDFNAKS